MARQPKNATSRHEIILAAATELFYQRGFAAVGVDEIGERAGVTGPAIYRHFKGKEEILSTLFDDGVDRLLEIAVVSEDAEPEEALETLARQHVLFILSERKIAGIQVREERSLSDGARRALHRRERRYFERWLRPLSALYPDRDQHELLTLLNIVLGGANAVATWSSDVLKNERLHGLIVEVVLGGLHSLDRVPAQTD